MNAKNFTKWDAKDLLDLFGLEARRSVGERLLPAAGILAIGLVIGVGIGLLYAPKEGAKLREDLSNRLSDTVRGVRDTLVELPVKMGITTAPETPPAKTAARAAARSSSTAS